VREVRHRLGKEVRIDEITHNSRSPVCVEMRLFPEAALHRRIDFPGGKPNSLSHFSMRPNPLRHRSPGERAFDRCVLPTALVFGFTMVGCFLAALGKQAVKQAPTDPDMGTWLPAAPWFIWLPFVCGILFAAYWLWALRSVMRSWADPVVRVLRFCSLSLLFGQFFAIISLLTSPMVRNAPVEKSGVVVEVR